MSPLALVRDGDKGYQYIDSYEIQDAQIDPVSAGYNPLGATATEGCANCQWFLAPGRCVVVSGDVSPTGLSALWRAKTAPVVAPILVQIVGSSATADKESSLPDSPSWSRRVLAAVKSALVGVGETEGVAATLNPPVHVEGNTPAFQLYWTKSGDGNGDGDGAQRLRFFTAWSNNFTDREGEIFPESAHKEFIEWADSSQQYPELWLWHTKGTKYGQVDWLDYTDGFVYASGLIDAGFEDLAVSLAKEDSGVSHGFHGLQRGNEIIQYRSFEISTLPRTNAAVWTTSFNTIGEGAKEMAFTPQKRTYLKEHGLDDAAIAAAETQATQLSKALKDLGVAYKDADIIPDPEPVAAVTAPVAAATTTTPVVDDKAAAAAASTAFQSEVLAALNKNTEVLAALAGSVKSIDDRVKAVERTDDEKVAAAVSATRVGAPTGAPASKSADNVVASGQATADQDWFGKTFVSGLVGAS